MWNINIFLKSEIIFIKTRLIFRMLHFKYTLALIAKPLVNIVNLWQEQSSNTNRTSVRVILREVKSCLSNKAIKQSA